MKKAIFPGSFDPFHEGHEFVINQALKDFDFLFIVISWNENKKRIESFNLTYEKLNEKYKNNKNIKILINDHKLTTDVAKELNCLNIVRGIRNNDDINYENNLGQIYKKQLSSIKIFYYKSDLNISSTDIKNGIIK